MNTQYPLGNEFSLVRVYNVTNVNNCNSQESQLSKGTNAAAFVFDCNGRNKGTGTRISLF